VNNDAFIEAVARQAEVPYDQAEVLTHATLETLAERVTGGEARDLASELPKALRQDLRKARDTAESFDRGEFVRRVGVRAGTDAATAGSGASAVLTTLREGVSTGEFKDLVSQLPKDVRELIAPSAAGSGVPPRRG
jgi:uncharacterized protein (DUF2267 family)